MVENNSIFMNKPATTTSPAKSGRRVRPSAADLKFISENQQLSGFSGRISEEMAMYEVDMDEIAESAARFGAQIPSP